jgi:hypothetical protein
VATQARPAKARAFWAAGTIPRNAVSVANGAGMQQVVGGRSRGAPPGHDIPHASGDRVGIDSALNRSPVVAS